MSGSPQLHQRVKKYQPLLFPRKCLCVSTLAPPGAVMGMATKCHCCRGVRASCVFRRTRSRLPRAKYMYAVTLMCSLNSATSQLRERL